MLKSVVSVLCILSFPVVTQAQDLPRFDGVYLGLKDGTFVTLNPFVGSMLALQDIGLGAPNEYGVAQQLVPQIYRDVALESDIQSAAFFDSSNLESIFIRSRTVRLQYVEVVTLTKDLPYQATLSVDDSIRKERIEARLAAEYPSLKGTDCGWNSSKLKLLNETETTYQYFFDGPGFLDFQGQDIPLFLNNGNGCKSATTKDGHALGFVLHTNQGKFLTLETDAMREFQVPGGDGQEP